MGREEGKKKATLVAILERSDMLSESDNSRCKVLGFKMKAVRVKSFLLSRATELVAFARCKHCSVLWRVKPFIWD